MRRHASIELPRFAALSTSRNSSSSTSSTYAFVWRSCGARAGHGLLSSSYSTLRGFSDRHAPPSPEVAKLMPAAKAPITQTGGALQEAPAPASGGGNAAAEKAWCDEPTLDDLDISIPQVDCPFVAELVHRRLEMRDEMHLPKHQRGKNIAAAAAAAGEAATATPAAPEHVFRAPVHDDTDNAGKELAAAASTTSTPAQTEAGASNAAQGEWAESDPNADKRWRDEYEDGFVVLDVRTVEEVTTWGIIEGAKLLPAHELWAGLSEMDAASFQQHFGFRKPDKKTDTLLLYCQYGPRSLMAAQIAAFLGYENVMILRDGYYEWAKQFNKLCRRFRLHDLETGNDDVRVEEFRVARAIGRDIAPEFNAIVEEEVDTLRIDTSRSRGKVQLPLPPLAEKLQTEVNEQKAIEGDLLNDPEYKLELLKQFDPMLEAAVLEPPLKLKGTESLRPTSATEKSRELQRSRLTSLGNSVADALGIPAAPTSRERLEESVGVRVMLAGKRRRAARVTKEMEELKVNEAEMRQRKRYPYKGTFRTF